MAKRILITGGTGYIGSHTAVELIHQGYEVVIVDDLSNSEYRTIESIEKITGTKPGFYQFDLRNSPSLEKLFKDNKFDGIIHFAAKKAVGESVEKPLLYYDVNLNSMLNLLKLMELYKVSNLVFSSSCTVYGQPSRLPVTEDTPFASAESPYGHTKQIGEDILNHTTRTNGSLQALSLRYFNPVGAHPSALIGELPIGMPANLVPFITQTVAGLRSKLKVYGNDYNTSDGTAVRDYIHVVDLAKAHVRAIERMLNHEQKKSYEYFNIGTGKGSSVLEVIQTFEKINHTKVPYEIVDRRAGDIVKIYADTTRANNELNWKAQLNLDDMMKSAWKWQKTLIS
ncbi:MAG: UDP-glucose 4-epimerase GalE [Flammeovirgaceae bacterium]|jgi:UDP-glucose 4-epimerase|nr:UDP-glucose 4-epimerase GalE [Flammeovirgaceae bacterium]